MKKYCLSQNIYQMFDRFMTSILKQNKFIQIDVKKLLKSLNKINIYLKKSNSFKQIFEF
jgi:hypothetical protein